MTFLILKMALLLALACAFGFGLAVVGFKRAFVEVDEDAVAAARAEAIQLAAERDELQVRLDAEAARQRSATDRAERLKAQLATVEKNLSEQMVAVERVDERIEESRTGLREENQALVMRANQRDAELLSLRNRLASAELSIKRKTELLRLSETDLTKGSLRHSYRPPDSRPPAPGADDAPLSTRAASSVPPLPSSLRPTPEPVREELAKARSLAARRAMELEALRLELGAERQHVLTAQERCIELERNLEAAAQESLDRSSQVEELREQIDVLRASRVPPSRVPPSQ